MAANTKDIDKFIQSATRGGFGGLPTDMDAATRQKILDVDTYQGLVDVIAVDLELGDDLGQRVASTTLYSQVERSGLNPLNWFPSLPDEVQAGVKYGPEEYNEALVFFKTWTNIQKAFFLLAIAAAIAIIVVGLPTALAATAAVSLALARGASITVVAQLVQIKTFQALPKMLIPGIVAGLAWMGNQFAQVQQTAAGDLFTYVKQNVARQEAELLKLEARAAGTGFGVARATEPTPRTRITMARHTSPQVAVGTLFQAIVKDVDVFTRQVEDKIKSAADLKADATLNLNNWLASLPGRLHYEIRVVLNPLDEKGNKRQGTWAMLMIGHRNMQGIFVHLSAIALGPLDPTIYNPTTKEIETIQLDIPKLLTSEEIMSLDLPTTGLRVVDGRGVSTPIQFDQPDKLPEADAPRTFAEMGPDVREGDIVTGRGTLLPDGTFSLEQNDTATPPPPPPSTPTPTPAPPTQEFQQGPGQAPHLQPAEPAPLPGTAPEGPAPLPVNIHSNLLDIRGTIYTKDTGRPFRSAAELANYLRIGESEIRWDDIEKFDTAPTTTNEGRFPFVRYANSPNVFDRQTGRHIEEAEAAQFEIFQFGMVQQFAMTRPEVTSADMQEQWNDKDLTQIPV